MYHICIFQEYIYVNKILLEVIQLHLTSFNRMFYQITWNILSQNYECQSSVINFMTTASLTFILRTDFAKLVSSVKNTHY
jgi:hypothetical protein